MAEFWSSQNLLWASKQLSHEKIYLETHTWHAKYFDMIDKWNHRILHHSFKDNLQANYDAITKNCLLQDISYYTCIEIVGEKNWLETALREHCDPKRTFAEKRYTNGQREGTVMFFKKKGCPEFPIGYVNFFWKPSQTDIKTIWIWVHPAFYSDFLSEIISSFEFEQNNAEQGRTDISHKLNDLYTNDAGCEMRVLKYALNRFRLSGPAALTVLKDALRVPSLTELDLDSENCPMTEEQDSSLNYEKLDTSTDDNVFVQLVEEMVIDENKVDTKDLTIHDLKQKMWHTKYYKEGKNIAAFKIQEQMWQSMKVLESPRFLSSNMIMGLTVLDPRSYSSERTKTEVLSPLSAANSCCELPTDLSHSPIWDAQIRHIVSNSCVSTKTIDKLEPSMSDAPYFNKDSVAKIPILLIQEPAVAPLDLGSRIDIIIPSRWALPFWIALTMPTPLPTPLIGGLRETELVVFESLRTYVPDINDPDTPAYMREALTKKEELTNEYFFRPLIQRFNFIEFGIHSPFFCDWKNLTKGWSDVENFYVLRDFGLLALLREEIKTIKRKNAGFESTVQESEFDFQKFDKYQNCLVQVKLSMDKGTPSEFAIICMPTHEDLRRFRNQNYDGPVEKLHTDLYKESRVILRKLHFMQLEQLYEQLSRYGVKPKKNYQGNVINDEINEMISDQENEMRKFELPESTEVRHSCDREVMGYVTMGGYSFLREGNIGIGYVTLPSLLEIICKKSNVVLVRNPKERQYKFVRLKILVDIDGRYK